MKEVYLIGVNHLQYDLNQKIYNELSNIKPNAITVEAKPGMVEYYIKATILPLIINGFADKKEFIPGLELVGAYQYATDNKINLYQIDNLRGLNSFIVNVERILSKCSKEELVNKLKILSKEVNNNKIIRFEKGLHNKLLHPINRMTLNLRDTYQAIKIKELLNNYEKLAHIGGLGHIKNLKKYLKDKEIKTYVRNISVKQKE